MSDCSCQCHSWWLWIHGRSHHHFSIEEVRHSLCAGGPFQNGSIEKKTWLLLAMIALHAYPMESLRKFLKMGDTTEDAMAVNKPKEMHSLGGVLEQMFAAGMPIPGIRTET